MRAPSAQEPGQPEPQERPRADSGGENWDEVMLGPMQDCVINFRNWGADEQLSVFTLSIQHLYTR